MRVDDGPAPRRGRGGPSRGLPCLPGTIPERSADGGIRPRTCLESPRRYPLGGSTKIPGVSEEQLLLPRCDICFSFRDAEERFRDEAERTINRVIVSLRCNDYYRLCGCCIPAPYMSHCITVLNKWLKNSFLQLAFLGRSQRCYEIFLKYNEVSSKNYQ